MGETFLHRTNDDTCFATIKSRIVSPLSSHFGFTTIILTVYFIVWCFADPTGWISQAFFAEDHLGEWLQLFCCLATSFYAFKAFRVVRNKWLSAAFLFGAVAMFFVGGEEISWGQRLFNFQSEYFLAKNFQGETNLHNLLPLESNILPYYAAALMVGLVLNVIGLKMTPQGQHWPFIDTLLSATLMGAFYVALPMSKHTYFYEYTELWIYGSILIFTMRILRNVSEERKKKGVL